MIMVSVGINGNNRYVHCTQYIKNDTHYVEARKNSELFLLIGNTTDNTVKISFRSQTYLIPNQSMISCPMYNCDGHMSIHIENHATYQLWVGSLPKINNMGINTKLVGLPSPFPADGKLVSYISPDELEKFFRTLNISNITNGMTETSIYLVSHPIYKGWKKICVGDEIHSLNNADPLKRYYAGHISSAKDNNLVMAQFLTHIEKEYVVKGDWIMDENNLLERKFIRYIGERNEYK